MKSRERDFRSLLIPAISIVSVSTVTLLIKYISQGSSESVDKLIVALWWAIPFAIVFWVLKSRSKFSPAFPKWVKPSVFYSLTGLALVFLVVAIFSRSDSYGFYRGFTLFDLSFGAALCAIVYFGIWGNSKRVAAALLAATFVCVEILALPVFFQWPGNIADAFHFPYIFEEISAVSIGHFPYSNFLPQYSAFLGYPIAPFLHFWSSQSPLVLTLYMEVLQLLCVGIIILLPVLVGGRRVLAPALIVATFPPLILMREVDRPITYFATIPLRVVLPSIIILLAFLWIRSGRVLTEKRRAWLIGLGAFGGLTVLNNLDYGIPAFGAVAITLFFAQKDHLLRVRTIAFFILGSLSFLIFFYLVGSLSGNTVHWGYFLAFAKLFGVENFMAIPIQSFGLHIAFTSLFVANTAIGINMLQRSSGVINFVYKQGVLLTLTGTFSLLSLAYFSSRSLVPTLISGYAFQVGMCCAALLPLLHFHSRALRAKIGSLHRYSLATSLFALLTVASSMGAVLLIGNPTQNIRHFVEGRSQIEFPDLVALRTDVNSVAASSSLTGRGVDPATGQIWQILQMPSMVQQQTGVLSASLSTHPVYLTLGDPTFRDFQCSQLEINKEIKYLIDFNVRSWK